MVPTVPYIHQSLPLSLNSQRRLNAMPATWNFHFFSPVGGWIVVSAVRVAKITKISKRGGNVTNIIALGC